jgi:hypothetical protein
MIIAHVVALRGAVLRPERHRHQRRPASSAIFGRIEPLAAQGVGDHGFAFVVDPAHAASVQAVRHVAS